MLDINLLQKVKVQGSHIISQCPACYSAGHDRSGNHLRYNTETEVYSCAAHQGDSAHRQDIFRLVGIKKDLTSQDKQERYRQAHRASQERRARDVEALKAARLKQALDDSLVALLEPYMSDTWRTDLLDRSPITFDCPDRIPHDFVLNLFHPGDRLWMFDSHKGGKGSFRTRDEWLELDRLPERIAYGTFKPDSEGRTAANILAAKFILIECDELIGFKPSTAEDKQRNKALSAALLRFLEDKLGLVTRAVIDTGNKSLHCWLDRPPPDELDALLAVSEGLRIDTAPITAANNPLRMPHCIHTTTDQSARLLFLNPIHTLTA